MYNDQTCTTELVCMHWRLQTHNWRYIEANVALSRYIVSSTASPCLNMHTDLTCSATWDLAFITMIEACSDMHLRPCIHYNDWGLQLLHWSIICSHHSKARSLHLLRDLGFKPWTLMSHQFYKLDLNIIISLSSQSEGCRVVCWASIATPQWLLAPGDWNSKSTIPVPGSGTVRDRYVPGPRTGASTRRTVQLWLNV